MVEEITIQELAQMEPSACQIIDMRDETAFALGHIDGAVLIPQKELETSHGELPRDKMLVIYCRSGILSADMAEQLRDEGYQAVNLVGGYVQWLQDKIRRETKNEKVAEVEQGLRKKFHRVIFSRFAKAIKTYDLIQPNDRIAVCISGGKDSMLMAKLFQELQRHGKFPFELVFPCYLCARMRRGHLYNKAKELGCNKIALGHHFDDVIETILMSMIYGGQVETMMPKLHSANFEGMQLIRPMYLIREADIKHWCRYHDLQFIQCACHFTDTCTTCDPDERTVSKRMVIKQLIAKLAEENPQIEKNIFRSVENINLNKIISYQKDHLTHSFLDGYVNE